LNFGRRTLVVFKGAVSNLDLLFPLAESDRSSIRVQRIPHASKTRTRKFNPAPMPDPLARCKDRSVGEEQ